MSLTYYYTSRSESERSCLLAARKQWKWEKAILTMAEATMAVKTQSYYYFAAIMATNWSSAAGSETAAPRSPVNLSARQTPAANAASSGHAWRLCAWLSWLAFWAVPDTAGLAGGQACVATACVNEEWREMIDVKWAVSKMKRGETHERKQYNDKSKVSCCSCGIKK